MSKHPIHRYQRKKTKGGTVLYRCNLPGCTHYLRSIFIDNQESLCNECGDKFVIAGNEKYKKLLLCGQCRGKKKKVKETVPLDVIGDLLGSLEIKIGEK